MNSAGTGKSDATAVIKVRKIDESVTKRRHEYPGIAKGTKVLVTTGGPSIAVPEETVAQLASAGCRVTILGEPTAAALAPEAVVIRESAMSPEACAKAVSGQKVVVHAGQPSSTSNLLDAAAAAGVKAFVFLSSASVVFDGKDLKMISEDAPYASRFIDPVSAAIAEAEKAVLNTNDATANSMLTCSVRAASVYGSGESEGLLPGLVAHAKTGASSIGDGANLVDFVYAGNVAHALLLATQGLLSPASTVTGQAFFVTDMEPVPFGVFSTRALSRLGYLAPGGGIPMALAVVLACLLRIFALVVSPLFEFRPTVTAQRVAKEGRVQRFDTSRAIKELGYAPLWTQEEGLDIALHAAESLRNPRAKVKHIGPFTAADVARHSSEDDAWIIVDGKVYEITPYLDQHPGGDAMLRNAGGDSSEGMHGPQHPSQAMEILEQHYIGMLEES